MLYQDMDELDKYKFDMDVEFVHNVYKDMHGVRPRINFYAFTKEELRVFTEDLLNEAKGW